jgi:hypothetical protein
LGLILLNLLATYYLSYSIKDILTGMLFFKFDLLLLLCEKTLDLSFSFLVDAFLSLFLLKFLILARRSPLLEPVFFFGGSFPVRLGGP